MSPAFEEKGRLPRDVVTKLIKDSVMGNKPGPPVEALVGQPVPAATKALADPLPVIKWACGILAVVSAVTSMQYTFAWFSTRGQGLVLASVLALVIGSCQSLLPELAIFFWKKRRVSSAVAGLLMAILAAIATVFSMGATIGGLYESQSARLMSAGSSVAEARSAVAAITAARDRKARAELAMAAFQRDADLYEAKVASLLAEDKSVYAYETRRDAARKGAQAEAAKIALADEEIVTLSRDERTGAVVREDFHSWLAGRFKATPEAVEFAMSVFPAVFNEVVAPAMFAVVLFL